MKFCHNCKWMVIVGMILAAPAYLLDTTHTEKDFWKQIAMDWRQNYYDSQSNFHAALEVIRRHEELNASATNFYFRGRTNEAPLPYGGSIIANGHTNK